MAREYKDSGIEWIGRIPKNWKTTSLKNTARGKNSLFIDGDWIESPHITNSGYRYLTTGNVGPLKYKEQGESYISEKSFRSLNCTRVYPGDLLIARLNEPIGRACVVPELGSPIVTAVDNVIYRPNEELTFKGFMLYMLNCPGFTDTANLMARGSTMHRLSRTMLGNLDIVIPPLAEQQRIADYLDEKCGEIDSLISLQEQMIAQLTDYKQSVITEAVTKGLDPNAQLVPSGIDWIGNIPKGWKVNKINRLFKIIGSGTTPNSSDADAYSGTINWLQSGDINGGIITEAKNKITKDTLAKYSALSVYKAPFIIVAMYGASVGNISISNIDACVNQACCVMSDSRIDFNYAFSAIKSAQRYLIYRAVGGGQPNISQFTLRQLWIPEPPISEQCAIADYLNNKCAEIDTLIALKQQKIETLKDYKKSLIYEAVTGKLEI